MIYLLVRAQKDSFLFFFAALFSGVGHLIRQDGILLLATILTCLFLYPISMKRKFLYGMGVIGIHLVIFSPLLIKNYQEMGFLLPPGPSTTRYLTEHDDVYAFGKNFTIQTYLNIFGWKGILNNKLQTAIFHIMQAYAVLNPGFVALAILSLAFILFLQRNRPRLSFFLPALIYGLYTYGFYIFIASFAMFSAQKSLVTLIPFLVILIVDFTSHMLRYRPLLIGLWIGLTIYLGMQGYTRAAWANSHFDSTYSGMKATQPLILENAIQHGQQPASIIVMTHNPWHYFEATNFRTMMIPNNDLDTILSVANSYDATYLILPAPRPALDAIYNGDITNPHLEYLSTVEEQKIYRFHFNP